jgi:hypothetical protein
MPTQRGLHVGAPGRNGTTRHSPGRGIVPQVVQAWATPTRGAANARAPSDAKKGRDDDGIRAGAVPLIHEEYRLGIPAVSVLTTQAHVCGERILGVGLQRDRAGLVEFASVDSEDAVVDVHVRQAQRQRFCDADPGAVQEANERHVGPRP